MKKITYLKSLFLLFALIVGSSSVWADDPVTISASTQGASKGDEFTSINSTNFSLSFAQNNSTNPVKYYSSSFRFYKINSGGSKGASVTISASNGYIVTAVTLTGGGSNFSASTGTYSNGNWTGSANSVEFAHTNTSGSTDVSSIVVTVIPDFTLTAESNNTSWGTVAVSGNKITATPATGYRVSTTTPYEVTSGTATVAQNNNEFTVTANASCTVRINFEAIPIYTVTYSAEGGTCGTTSSTETIGGAGVTLPTATCSKSGWELAGWATASVANTSTRPTLYLAGETFYPTANTNLYAVYTLEGVDGTKYKRATSLDEITSSTSVILVHDESSKVIDHALGSITAPTEENGMINYTNNIVWNIEGNNTDGFTVTTTSLTTNKTLGINSIPSSSANVDLTSSNKNWLFVACTYTGAENMFILKNKTLNSNDKVGSLEYYSNKWKLYCLSANTYTGNSGIALKVYIPVNTTYNSNPTADITQPTVNFTNSDKKVLYLDGTTTYTNTASVTGVDKSVSGYKSSNTNVVTVDANGVVTAVGIGTATITATLDAELGVHKAASTEYTVEVKSTTTIAGIKALTNSSTVASFTADLTDAVVTYVQGDYAYIQDATAAISINFSEHGLIAGKKINGAISGTVKAPNQIDQLISLDLSEATVTDGGVIPAAAVKTLAEIKTAGTDYDGKLVTVNAVSVSKSGTTTNLTDGSKIDDQEVSFTMYSPNSGISVNNQEKGNFTGFVSIYVNGTTTTYRLNLYEQTQFVKTYNAPTAQALTFDKDAIVLDEETDAYTEFAGQIVSGAQGTVSYAIDGDAIGTVNAEMGVVTLNGSYGTATITATAAAANVEVDGVTTPYTETTKSYTVTVNPRYTVNFSINGEANNVRQSTYGAAIDVPEVEFLGSKVFVGWGEAADATETVEMEGTYTPTADKTFYALFATETVGEDVIHNEWYKNTGAEGTDATTGITAAGNVNANNGNSKPAFGLTSNTYNTITLTGINLASFNSASMVFDYQLGKNSTDYTTITVKQYDSSNKQLGESKQITGTNNNAYLTTEAIAINTGCKKITIVAGTTYPAYVDNIIIATTSAGISYENFTSNVGTTNVIVDGNAESIDLSAMTDASPLAGVHADAITYTRTMGKLSTLYLPYASTIPTGMTAYEFNGINDAGTALNFTAVEGSTLEAYTPYVLEQNTSALQTLNATDVDIVADTHGTAIKGTWTFKGTAEMITNADLMTEAGTGTAFIVQSDGKWHHVETNDAVYIPAFRAYFISSEANGAKLIDMNLGGETTGIDALNDDASTTTDNAPAYNLAGQKVGSSYKGIVVVNGKKVVRK